MSLRMGGNMKELMSIKAFDSELYFHCRRTADLRVKVSSLLNLDPVLTYHLSLAARLHDIGKIKINKDILNKPGPLTADERKIIDSHCLEGYKILKDAGYPNEICEIVLLHHGKSKVTLGYDKKNCISAEILRACDIYDAVTHDRPYHLACKKEEGLEILASQKEKLPVNILKVFFAV